MASIRREIEIAAALPTTRASWDHFLQWVRTSKHRLACDELACTDAVGTGVVSFAATATGRTRMTVQVDSDGGPGPEIVGQQLIHDMLVFKDYLEHRRGDGMVKREDLTRLHDDQRYNEPAHLHTSEANHNAPAGGSYTDRFPT